MTVCITPPGQTGVIVSEPQVEKKPGAAKRLAQGHRDLVSDPDVSYPRAYVFGAWV